MIINLLSSRINKAESGNDGALNSHFYTLSLIIFNIIFKNVIRADFLW